MTETNSPDETRLREFEAALSQVNLQGHWQMNRGAPSGGAQLWKWSTIHQLIMQAGALIPMENTGRRTLKLVTPGLTATTPSIQMSVQLVLPGEVAYAHRHAFAATRFIVQGSGAYTTVDGEPLHLTAGDYVTTPSMAFHDHTNESSEPIIWLDVHDNPFVGTLKIKGMGGSYPEPTQPKTVASGTSRDLMGIIRPANRDFHPAHRPAGYPWAEVRPALERAAAGEGDPCDGILMDYANPVTGGHCLPTIGARIQMLRPKERTQPHRHTSYSVYHVVEGEGVSVIGDQRFEWAKGDCFTVPSWEWHTHEQQGDQPAILFSAHNQPILEAFDLYREEREEG